METLLIALGVIGAIFAVAFIYGAISENLQEKTGMGLGDWFANAAMSGLYLLVGYGGYRLIRYSMDEKQVFGAILALIIMAIAGAFLYATWFMNSGHSYNPMSGKRAHYNKDGQVTGYSDKD